MRSGEAIPGVIADRLGRLSAFVARQPIALDGVVALTLGLASGLGLAIQARLHHHDTIVFCAALPLALLVRSFARRAAFTVVAIVALVQWFVSTPQIADAAVLVALLWVALDGDLAEVVAAAAVTEAGAVMASLRWSPDDAAKFATGITGLVVAATAIGLVIRERRALLASMAERAARLEFERDQEGRLGAAAERARIAREMHDIVSHNLTVMIGLADGAGYALSEDPDGSRIAIANVSQTGRQALGEMRRLLGVLRDEPEAGSYEPQPSLERLDELLARVQAAGIPVSLALSGDPRGLTAGLQLAIFRIAQEALTNTLKHAGRPASAQLALRCGPDEVELEVTDTGRRALAASAAARGGRGLAGMRERAAAYGGTLDAGPAPGGGWRVHLRLGAEAPLRLSPPI